jgi:hypothetical protein
MILAEISMTMRVIYGLEEMNLPYLAAMVIIACIGYFTIIKATTKNINPTEKEQKAEFAKQEPPQEPAKPIDYYSEALTSLRTTNEDEPDEDEEDEFSPVLDHFFLSPFLELDTDLQAKILSIYLQIKHNNPCVDNYRSNIIAFLLYSDFDKGYDFFKKYMDSINEIKLANVKRLFSIIDERAEFYRLLAVMESLKGNKEMENEYFKKSTEMWQENSFLPKTYPLNLLKTKADLLISKEKYSDAFKMLAQGYNLLKDFENASWLKYQFLTSSIKLMKILKIDSDIKDLSKEAKKLLHSAQVEDDILRMMYNS